MIRVWMQTRRVLASLAVAFKGGALRLGGDGTLGTRIVWWVELAGALLVMAFGLILLFAVI